jgi:ribosomal protein S18 acetylase RimI-like enzyme
MNATVEYLTSRASETEIAEHLSRCDADFVPRLSGRVQLEEYAKKIVSRATRFEAWSDGTLVGLVAVYCNDQERRIAYITSVSVLMAWTGKGIAACLMNRCIEHAKALGMRLISMEVAEDNVSAIELYEKCGFVAGKANCTFVSMSLYLRGGEEHEQQS